MLRDRIDKGKTVVYLVDIGIAMETFEERLEIFGQVLQSLSAEGLRLNFEKCKFAFNELDYLGYKVNNESIRPNDIRRGD